MDSSKYRFCAVAGGVVCSGLAVSLLVMTATAAFAATYTWSGAAFPDAAMSTGANWVGNLAPEFFSPLSVDDVVFTGSTNTSPLVPPADLLGVLPRVSAVTFDASASAFTIGPADADHYLNLDPGAGTDAPIVNNSTATQTLGAIAVYAGTVNAAAGPLVFNYALNVGGGNSTAGFDVTFVGSQDITLNGGLAGAGTSSSGGGRFLHGVSGDSTSRTGTTHITGDSPGWAGKTEICAGAIRISSNNALGDGATRTVIQGGGASANASLELAGGITVPENILYQGRDSLTPCIRNVSGNNTMTGAFSSATGGGNYVFASDGGKLTINSSLVSPSAGGTRRFYLYGTGVGEVAGGVNDYNTADGKVWSYFRKYDSGTWILSGTNTYSKTTEVYDGAIALAGAGTINATPGVRLYAATSKFDVSGLTSGLFTLGATKAQFIDGIGTVVGNVSVAGGSTIRAGVNAVAMLTCDGDLTLQSGAYNNWQLGTLTDDATGIGGIDFDQIVVKNGDLDLGAGAVLRVYFGTLAAGNRPADDPLNSFWNSSHTWKVIDVDADNGGTNTGGTDFASIVFADIAEPTAVTFDTFVGTTAGVDLGDVFLRSTPSLPPIPGDTNNDRIVDATDADKLSQNWGKSTGITGPGDGDFNGDGKVNALDAAILTANWGDYRMESLSADPDPSAAMLLLALALATLTARRRR